MYGRGRAWLKWGRLCLGARRRIIDKCSARHATSAKVRRMTESMLEALASHVKSSSEEPDDLRGGSLRRDCAGTVPGGADNGKHARSFSSACEEFS